MRFLAKVCENIAKSRQKMIPVIMLFFFLRILFYALSNDVSKFCKVSSSTFVAWFDSERKYFLLRIISYISNQKIAINSFRYEYMLLNVICHYISPCC